MMIEVTAVCRRDVRRGGWVSGEGGGERDPSHDHMMNSETRAAL